jgi:hypothetical protein
MALTSRGARSAAVHAVASLRKASRTARHSPSDTAARRQLAVQSICSAGGSAPAAHALSSDRP